MLKGGPEAYRLQVHRPGADDLERDLTAPDLASALAECPEITRFTAHDCLEIECHGEATRRTLRSVLVDHEPDVELDEELWPPDSAAELFFWFEDDVYPQFEDLLRLRWLVIDGVRHAVLAVVDRTHVVAVLDGEIEPDRELISVHWYGESAATSFEGTDVIGLIGGAAPGAARRADLVAGHQDLEGLDRPGLRGQDAPCPGPLRPATGGRASDLRRRVRAAEPHPRLGRSWFATGRPARVRATYHRTAGVRHLFCALNLARSGQILYRIREWKRSSEFRDFLRQLRQRFPTGRLYVIVDNFAPHRHRNVAAWTDDHDVELVFLPTNASWLNWIESEFAALRYFALAGTDHRSHDEQNRAIANYLRWRNQRCRPERNFAVDSKIRKQGYLPNVA